MHPAFVRWEQRGLGQKEPESTSSPYLHVGRSYGHCIFQSLLLPFGPTLHLPLVTLNQLCEYLSHYLSFPQFSRLPDEGDGI